MKSNFTHENRAKIIARLEAGLTMDDAATATDQSAKTVNSWLDRGRKEPDSSPYAEFVQEVVQARERASKRPPPMDEQELISVVSGQARAGSVQAAKLLYEILRAGEKPPKKPKPQSTALQEIDELAARRQDA